MDDIPHNRDRDGWDYLEGRGTPPPGTPSNVVAFPIEPPKHIATSQIILADAGLLPVVPARNLAPDEPPAVVSDERGMSLLVRLTAHLTGYGKPPKEPWER
jgi:hypothetical protein